MGSAHKKKTNTAASPVLGIGEDEVVQDLTLSNSNTQNSAGERRVATYTDIIDQILIFCRSFSIFL